MAFDQAATNLLLLSPDYFTYNEKFLESLLALLQQQRVFLADYHPVERPQVLTGLLSYCFWQVDPTQGLRSLVPADHEYSLLVENLAEDIEKRLNALFQQQQLKAAQTSGAVKTDSAPHDAVVFVNAATEDRSLAQQIQQSLGQNGVASTLPLDHSLNPPPADIRRDFEINLLNCDATLVIYDASSSLWAKEQLLMCHRWQRKREEPLKIIALHNGNGELPDVHLPNLQIFYCPPETVEEYLTKFIGALQ